MSQDELVDIVDENENFIKTVAKREAHEKGLLHKTVIGGVIDSQGKWMLVKQSKDRQDAGQYVSPVGGHVTSGETDNQALERESEEELGWKGSLKYELVGKKIFDRHVIGRHENHFFIFYKIYSDIKPILSHEADDFRYFSEEELKKEIKENPKMFGDAFHFVVKEFFPHLL